MWRLNALARRNLPFAVFLKRFAAPRWVLILGMVCVSSYSSNRTSASVRSTLLTFDFCLLTSHFLSVFLSLRRQDRVELVAFLLRLDLHRADLGQLVDEPLEDAPPDLGMGVLAAAEEDGRLDLVAFAEEPLDVLLLELIVVLVDLRPELDLLDEDHLLVLFRRSGALLLLVLVLAEVHDPAHRRHGGRRDFHEIQSLAARERQRLRRRHDPELLPGIVNHANFTDPDALVRTDAVVTAWAAVESDKNLLLSLGAHFGQGVVQERFHRAAALIASRAAAHGDGALGGLAVADHKHVRHLLNLGLSNLITNLLDPAVDFDPQARLGQPRLDGPGVREMTVRDRQDSHLFGRQPQRKRPAIVLDEQRDEPLEAAVNRAVDDHRLVFLVVGAGVFEAEPRRHLIVELNRRALPLAPDRVGDVEVDFRPVERAVAFIDAVVHAGRGQAALELGFGVIPGRALAQILLGPRRQLHLIGEPEVAVDALDQVQQPFDFLADL